MNQPILFSITMEGLSYIWEMMEGMNFCIDLYRQKNTIPQNQIQTFWTQVHCLLLGFLTMESLEWLPITFGEGPLNEENGFFSQALSYRFTHCSTTARGDTNGSNGRC